MVGRPKQELRKKAKAGDPHARMALEELRAAADEKTMMDLIKVQPLFFLRGVQELRSWPFPSPQVRQFILSSLLASRTLEQIAGALGRTVEELREHYADEIEHGPTAVIADAMTTLIGLAVMGDAKLLVPLLRSKAGLVEPKDQIEVDETSPAQLAQQSAQLVNRILDLVDSNRRGENAIDITPKVKT